MSAIIDKDAMGMVQENSQITSAQETGQYTFSKIISILALVALPMGLIMWVVVPTLIPYVDMEPGFLFYILITLGMVWQGAFAYIILKREVKPFTWTNIKDRLWLHRPTDPRTGVPSNRLYLWTIPLILFSQGYYALEVLGRLDELWVQTFPLLAQPSYAVMQNVAEPAVRQWWLLG